MSLLTTTTLAAAVPLLLLGPPRLTVAAGAPGQPLTVTAEHFDGVEHILISARAIHLKDGRPAERSATVVEAEAPGPNHRAFLLTPPRTSGVPLVLVIRGEHGEDGPAMEAMVRIDGAGAVVGIEYAKRRSLLGGMNFKPVSDDDVLSALREMSPGRR